MSGLGKTYISEILRQSGNWFHYSVDYRIGTRYMGEHITDNFKAEAMKVPFLAELLRQDAIYIASNIKFHDLSPLSSYLGKPGDTAKGGIEFNEYQRRQRLHRDAEIASMKDTVHFIDRAKALYGYDHFICDTSGSMVEVVDGNDPNDPVLTTLRDHVLPIWIQGSPDHKEVLVKRFKANPKPIYYREEVLIDLWSKYLEEKGVKASNVDPDDFIVWGFRRQLEMREPRYASIAKNWGLTVSAADVSLIKSADDFENLVAMALDANS